jgi:hypothetical protein
MEFTEEEHTVFCSALSEFLQGNDVTSKHCAVLLEFLIEQEQENQDHPMSESSPNQMNTSTDIWKPLHANGQLVDFNKIGSFNLDFNCFNYKVLKNGSKIERGTDEAIWQAESRATRKLVAAILESGDDDSQRALVLHRSLCHESIRCIAKSAGFQSEKMSAMTYHMDQLRGILEAGSSTKGRSNIDQTLVTDTILAAVAAGSPSKTVPTMKNSMELLGIKNTGSGRSRMKRAMMMRKNIKVAKSTSRNAK